MAGIYIHIPFCKTHCSYCDFYSVTNSKNTSGIVDSICAEFVLRNNYLAGEPVETIYFGGGTPSYIATELLEKILLKIYSSFSVPASAEITIEVNPDDINSGKAKEFSKIGFNRASMGIQSFNDKILTILKRRHNSRQAVESIKILKEAGFTNLSIDLIYGIPGMTYYDWEKTLEQAVSVNVPHISAYHLTIEKGTELYSLFVKREITDFSDYESERFYTLLCDILKKNGYEHYEISNFSLPGYKSKHNNGYWDGKKYLGAGPSAHSFNGISRQWNVSDTNKYISEIQKKGKCFSVEKLTEKDRYNEYLLTRLRTSQGVSLSEINELFGQKYLSHFLKQAGRHLKSKYLAEINNNTILIPENKWFISDGIISDLCKI